MIERGYRIGSGLLFAVVLMAAPAVAQDYVPIAPLPIGTHLLNVPTAQILPHRMWEVRFTHRFAQPINEGDAHSFWGLDGPADIGIGLAWAPTRQLEVSLFRTDVQDNWEGAAKYVLVRQAPAFPVSATARAGVDFRSERGVDERLSGFAQVVISRQLTRRLELMIVPTWASEAGPFDHAFNVPVGLAWMLRRNLSLVVEIIPENRDLPDGGESDIGWAIGLKRAIGGHYFEILLADTRATHVSQYASSTLVPDVGLDAGDVHLGFNIVRRFGGR